MKKSFILLAFVLVIATVASATVHAGWQGTSTLPTIYLNTTAGTFPTIDGDITDSEGWSAKSPFDESSVGHFWAQMPLSSVGEFKFAASEEGLYFAMAVAEQGSAWKTDENGNNTEYFYEGNTFIYSTGEDDINDGEYGYNGDIIVLGIDPGRILYNAGYTDNASYSPWYCIGVFEDGTVKVYREKVNNGDITAQVKAAGKGANNGPAGGCNVEVFFPWDVIIKDVNDLAELEGDDIKLTKADIISAAGAETKATVMYQDRYFDPELRENTTWGRYITVPEFLPNGIKGSGGSGDDIKSYGVTLNITGEGTPETSGTTATSGTTEGTTSTTTAATTTAAATTAATTKTSNSSGTKTSSGSSSTSTGTKTTGTTTDANTTTETETVEAATTLDTGIVVSAAILGISAGAYIYLGKKRKNEE